MIAGGFSCDGCHFLAVSHAGRGVYACSNWTKVARDDVPAYPQGGASFGIGPIDGACVPVVERGDAARLICESACGTWRVTYEDGVATVIKRA
jgi:hypothetical protein